MYLIGMAVVLLLILLLFFNRLINKCFVAFCLSAITSFASGQTLVAPLTLKDTTTAYQLLVKSFQQRYTKSWQWATKNAKKKGWFINKKYANGRIVTLQGVDAVGEPIYYTSHNVVASIGTHTTGLYVGGGLGVDLKGDLPELDGRLCIWDGGLPRLSHVEFGGRVRQKDQGRSIGKNHHPHGLSCRSVGFGNQVWEMTFFR